MLPDYFLVDLNKDEAKKKIFLKRKFQNGRLKTNEFFNDQHF